MGLDVKYLFLLGPLNKGLGLGALSTLLGHIESLSLFRRRLQANFFVFGDAIVGEIATAIFALRKVVSGFGREHGAASGRCGRRLRLCLQRRKKSIKGPLTQRGLQRPMMHTCMYKSKGRHTVMN